VCDERANGLAEFNGKQRVVWRLGDEVDIQQQFGLGVALGVRRPLSDAVVVRLELAWGRYFARDDRPRNDILRLTVGLSMAVR